MFPFNPFIRYPVLNPQSLILSDWQHKHNELESRDKAALIGLLIAHSDGNNPKALVMQTVINSI